MSDDKPNEESPPQASGESPPTPPEPEAKPYDPGPPDPQLMISLEERGLQLPFPQQAIEKKEKA
jgi:hypothetical protein